MKRISIIIAILFSCLHMRAQAQLFLDRLQKSANGQGTVSVSQSRAITDLVNGTVPLTTAPQQSQPTAPAKNDAVTAKPAEPVSKPNAKSAEPNTKNTEQGGKQPEQETGIDTHKKVMKNSYKVDGYRVQVFAGGNTRNDRLKAEKTGNDIKALFPTEPVYVHFYSPRWICRVGNYRTYEEAHAMLTAIRHAGYQQAAIVKGKISVQY